MFGNLDRKEKEKPHKDFHFRLYQLQSPTNLLSSVKENQHRLNTTQTQRLPLLRKGQQSSNHALYRVYGNASTMFHLSLPDFGL